MCLVGTVGTRSLSLPAPVSLVCWFLQTVNCTVAFFTTVETVSSTHLTQSYVHIFSHTVCFASPWVTDWSVLTAAWSSTRFESYSTLSFSCWIISAFGFHTKFSSMTLGDWAAHILSRTLCTLVSLLQLAGPKHCCLLLSSLVLLFFGIASSVTLCPLAIVWPLCEHHHACALGPDTCLEKNILDRTDNVLNICVGMFFLTNIYSLIHDKQLSTCTSIQFCPLHTLTPSSSQDLVLHGASSLEQFSELLEIWFIDLETEIS